MSVRAILTIAILLCAGSAHAVCPALPSWAKSIDENCSITVDSGPVLGDIVFEGFVGGNVQLTGRDQSGKIKPDVRNYTPYHPCGTANALWWNNVVRDVSVGDLSNPNNQSRIAWWFIKDSTHKNVNNSGEGHQDIIQTLQGPGHLGGWIVLQDSTFKDTDVNLFIWSGWRIGVDGYGHKNANCVDNVGIGGIL